MSVKPERRVAHLSGTPGFTLPEVTRLLAAEWRLEEKHIEDALFGDLFAGVFDPPREPPVNQNGSAVEMSADFAYCWEVACEHVDLHGNKQVTLVMPITSKSSFSYYRAGHRFGIFDDTVYDRTIIPEGAIVRFCTRWERPAPGFLKEGGATSGPSEEEIYEALKTVGSEKKYNHKPLAAEVSRRLGKRVTSTMRPFKRAVARAQTERHIAIADSGRPEKPRSNLSA
jgi:hypothetical protein